MEYTLEMLLDDIYDTPKESEGKTDSIDKADREVESKRIVMQMLIELASKCKANGCTDEENLRKDLEVKVNGDELLSGYVFFVPQNPQFDYTWNYMRKRKRSYVEFLVNAVRFVYNVISDTNILAQAPRMWNDVRFLFNDIFEVAFTPETPTGKIRVQWENFYLIATIKKYYNVVAKIGEAALVSRDRKNGNDVDDLIKEVRKIAGNTI